jgi:hypothetical protein
MTPEQRERRLAQQRAYQKANYKPIARKSTKGTRRVSVNKNERYRFILQLKFERGECFDCGWKVDEWNHAAMEWDHRIPAEKSFTISSMWKHTLDYEAIRNEADKCDLVCANCHRMRTYWARDHDHRRNTEECSWSQLGLFDEC